MILSVAFQHRFDGLTFDISFQAPVPGTTVLFGRSGSGKSTVISAISGLLRPKDAVISVGGERLDLLPPEQRRVGIVFQDSRLFPHMSVGANLRYGERRAPPGAFRFNDVVELLGLERFLDRRPNTLSGGERSRVAIGRALLSQPRLLALDEPLASLDSERKSEILPYLARLKHGLSLPVIYVTHALDEVARLADTLVLIRSGRVMAAGPLTQILARGDLPLAARDDAASVLSAVVCSHDVPNQLTLLSAGCTRLLVPLLGAPRGSSVRVRVPAREVILAVSRPDGISVHNIVPGTVGRIVSDPSRHASLVEVALDNGGLLARVTPDAVARLGLTTGKPVLALVKSMAMEVLIG